MLVNNRTGFEEISQKTNLIVFVVIFGCLEVFFSVKNQTSLQNRKQRNHKPHNPY